MADQTPGKAIAEKFVPLEWPDSSGTALYANNLLAQCDGNFMYLSFCQVNPPYLLGTVEEKQKQLEQIKSLQAALVARLVIPVDAFRAMFEVLQQQVAMMKERESADARITTKA